MGCLPDGSNTAFAVTLPTKLASDVVYETLTVEAPMIEIRWRQSDLPPVSSTSTTSSSTSPTTQQTKASDGISTSTKAAVGSVVPVVPVVAIVGICLLVLYCWKRRLRARGTTHKPEVPNVQPELGSSENQETTDETKPQELQDLARHEVEDQRMPQELPGPGILEIGDQRTHQELPSSAVVTDSEHPAGGAPRELAGA
jgi:hypothetical protein